VLTISTATILSQLNQAVDFSKYFIGIYVFIRIFHARLILLHLLAHTSKYSPQHFALKHLLSEVFIYTVRPNFRPT
jgi:hypothetical protein